MATLKKYNLTFEYYDKCNTILKQKPEHSLQLYSEFSVIV